MLATVENELQSEENDSIQTALRSARYQIGLIDMANAGEINHDHINFKDELKEANSYS